MTGITDSLRVGDDQYEIQWIHHGTNDRPAHRPVLRPVLVFLHEGLGCTALWKDFPDALCRETGCSGFIYSRLGYGGSGPGALPWKINFMHTHARYALPRVLEAAGIRDHILIGHSDGGSIGIVYAAGRHKGHLKGLITEAAHVFCEPVTVDSIRAARQAYLEADLKQRLARYHGENTENAFWGWNDVWLNPRFMHWNIEKYLKQIRVPVLALQGRDDQYGTRSQLASIRANVRSCESHLMPNCRHAPHHEQPRKTLDLMADFIRRQAISKDR